MGGGHVLDVRIDFGSATYQATGPYTKEFKVYTCSSNTNWNTGNAPNTASMPAYISSMFVCLLYMY